MKKNEELNHREMKPVDLYANIAGPLRRHKVSQNDHPLNLGTSSPWHQYFQVITSFPLIPCISINIYVARKLKVMFLVH